MLAESPGGIVMKRAFFSLCVGAVGCMSIMLCPLPAIAKGRETVLYAFGGKPDGAAPSSVIEVGGTLYGTTSFGGTGTSCSSNGCGTVFAVDASTGAETVLYSFCGNSGKKTCQDGEIPGGLVNVKGTLYGATQLGGTYQAGTVFAFDTKTGEETVLHSFCRQQGCADGNYPNGKLTDVNGILYGTTQFGGAYNEGTVFTLDPATGAETVLYSFCSGGNPCADGDLPNPALIDVDGTLYGTTGGGGANCQNSGGCGTLFALDPNTGAETVLYSFCGLQNCADGDEPASGLIDVDGTLYGATVKGGANHDSGTLFAFDPDNSLETVVYSFCRTVKPSCKDGAAPDGSLIDVNGKLYGTTLNGGKATVACSSGCGTVFEVDPANGVENVLYSFCSRKVCGDGEFPAGLIAVKGTFYGRTLEGGSYGRHCNFGCGTVFELTR
jgi:uncharacterized repeat protein (TIGR03803 family)